MQQSGRKGKDKLFNFRPVFFTAVFLCLGIVFSYLKIFHGISWWWLFLLLGLGILFIFCGKERWKKTAVAILVLLAAFFIGFFSFMNQAGNFLRATEYDGVYSVTGTVEEKSVYGKQTQLVLSKIKVGESEENCKLIAYLPTTYCENVQLSDVVMVRGNLQTDVRFYDDYGFRDYAVNENIKYQLTEVESCRIIDERFNLFAVIRGRVSKVLYRGMDDEPAAVCLAVLTGNTSGIESGLLENIRYGGIAHIFAVSGLHIGALYAFCLLVTAKTPLKKAPKIARFCLVAATLFFYGGICGFSASVIRAIVLCLVNEFARLLCTSIDRLETMGLAAIIILLISPAELFGAGFQLSFVAYMGILLLQKSLEKWGNSVCAWVKEKCAKTPVEEAEKKPAVTVSGKIRQAVLGFLSTTIAAQIATAPVLLYSFGYLSVWSLLLNCIFVPFISAVFSVLLIFVVTACVLPIGASAVVLYLPNVVWSAVLLVFESADFSALSVSGVTISVGACVCYYGGLTFVTDKWNLTKKWQNAFAALCFAGFVCVLLGSNL